MIETKRSLDNLEFYAPIYNSKEKNYPDCLGYYNIFNNVSVRENIALYKLTKSYKDYEARCSKKNIEPDWAFWVFAPFWCRYEYESGIGDGSMDGGDNESDKDIFFREVPYGQPFTDDKKWNFVKTDIYTLVIKPNERLIRSMVDEISAASCRETLKALREKQKATKKMLASARARKQGTEQ